MAIKETEDVREQVRKVREALDFLLRNDEYISDALETLHRTEQQMVMRRVIVNAIKHFAEVYNDTDRVRYDGRNEYTVVLCDRIVREIDTLDYLPLI